MIRCEAESGPQTTAMASGEIIVRDRNAIVIGNIRC